MATLTSLRHQVADATGRQTTSSAGQVDELINDAYFEIALSGRLGIVSDDLDLVSGQADYSITSDLDIENLYSIDYITFSGASGTSVPCQPTDLGDLLSRRATGAPVNSVTPFLYALDGDTLSFYPTPGVSDTAVVWYTAAPTVLGANDEPDPAILPRAFHDILVWRAASRSALTIGKGENQLGIQMSQMFNARYQERLIELKRWRNRRLGALNPTVQIGPPVRPRSRNDQYWHGDNV